MSVGYGLAFIAGVATFFATCLVPVLPVYLAYLGGISLPADNAVSVNKREAILTHSVVFIFGFLLVFSMLGLAATELGRLFAEYRIFFQKAGGILIIIFGLGLMDILKIKFFSKTYRLFMPAKKNGASFLGAFLFGMTFGFAWVPCIGPVLATILFLVSLGKEPMLGVTLLGVFALGLGTPFLILGIFMRSITPAVARLHRSTRYVQSILGACIVLVGLLLITDSLGILSQWTLAWGGTLAL